MTERERLIAAKAIWWFSIWRNGELMIGSPEKTYKSVEEKILLGQMDSDLDPGEKP